MSNYKVSVVIPTFNEEKTIKKLLYSLINQTEKIDEIIISDNNSTDSTKKIIESFAIKNHNIRVLDRDGICRGSGRNQAINNSKNDLIALIDAGTYADKNWIKNLLIKFKNGSSNFAVFGCVKIIHKNLFQQSIAASMVPHSKENFIIDESVSSLLITKNTWKKIGKFPESKKGDYIVEDLIFIDRIKKDFKVTYADDAYINWLIPNNLKQLFLRYLEYSEGGYKNGFFRKWHYGIIRNLFIFIILILISIFYNYFIFTIILLIYLRPFLYLRKKLSYKSFNFYNKAKSILSLSYILILIDLASILGIIKGSLK